jgi:type I restriction enzyme, R subunit
MPLSEADTHAKLVNPAIYARGWTEDHIKREETIGAVELIAGKARRRSRGRTDLTLRIVVTADMQPVAVAVIEVKKDTLPPGHGLDQAKGYAKAKLLNVPFVYSTNGHLFVEFDRATGQTTMPQAMSEFPSPADLRARYEAAMGFSLDSPAAAPLLMPYKGGEGGRRYYQDAAIRAVFEKVARDQASGRPPRALLSLATGAGKTFIAANLLRRIHDAGQLRRALFLCDRDELRRQALAELTNYFGDAAREVYRDSAGKNHARNAAVQVATYQTLGVDQEDGDESFLTEFYPPNHFSHILIDECHRSAWGKWSKVLKMNPQAVQIGLTATPRQLTTTEETPEGKADASITADNLAYFGEPVYEYEIAQAMEDGYLAACDIKLALVDLDARGITAAEIIHRHPTDADTGQGDCAMLGNLA